MSSEFWQGGDEAYEDGLKEHYEPRIEELMKRLGECTTEEGRVRLEREIEATKSEYNAKIDEIDGLIF